MKLIENQTTLTVDKYYLRYFNIKNNNAKRAIIFKYDKTLTKILRSKTNHIIQHDALTTQMFDVWDEYNINGIFDTKEVAGLLFELNDDEVYQHTTLEEFTKNI